MRTHKRQHFVPQAYLKAWCDPTTPAGQEPYVWRFSKDGSESRPKAPAKIFRETDLYTIPLPGGGRDLVLEHGLSGLEGTFVRIRDGILARRKEPTAAQRMMLCAFIAAAHARTPTQRDHLGGHWAKVLQMMDRIKERAETATPEQRHGIATPGGGSSGPAFSYEDVNRMAEQPMQTMLRPQITAIPPSTLKPSGARCRIASPTRTAGALGMSERPNPATSDLDVDIRFHRDLRRGAAAATLSSSACSKPESVQADDEDLCEQTSPHRKRVGQPVLHVSTSRE